MKRLIKITTPLIKESRKLLRENTIGRYACCPIALAAQRRLGRPDIHVTQFEIYAQGPYVSRELPRTAKQFIERFDMGKSVEPFAFYIDWPEVSA